MTKRVLAFVAALGALSALWATPAGADAARPTNYRSEVTSVTPPTDVIDVEVVGGDGFLSLRVDAGHTVVVSGYRDEPYLRFSADGTVEQNINSPAAYLNENRYGGAAVPGRLLADELPDPTWEKFGSGGKAVWHDHRIHFMGKDPSAVAGLAEGRPVDWTVGLTVDGEPVEVAGNFRLYPQPSPLPWLVLAAAVAVGLALLGRGSPTTVAGAAVVLAGAVGTAVGWAHNSAVPAAAGSTPLTVLLPLIGLLAGVAALVRRRTPAGVVAVLAAVAVEVGWVITRFSVLSNAVLPTDLAPALDRAGTALVLGAAVGAAVLVVRSGGLLPESARSTPSITPPAGDPTPAG